MRVHIKRPSEAYTYKTLLPLPSEATIEPQSDPSLRPSPSTYISNSIPESSDGNQGGHSSSDKSLSRGKTEGFHDQAQEIQHLKHRIQKLKKQAKPVITHHKAWMKSVSLKQRLARKRSLKKNWIQKESVSKQGRKSAKGEPSVHKDPLFDEIPEDTLDNMRLTDAQITAQQKVSTDKEKVSTDRPKVSTDGSKVSTDKEKDSTDRTDEGSSQHVPSQSSFKRKEKGVELKDVEETERPRPTSTRSLLTLNPLPKIDPKDKGKKKIKEEDESETESEGIPEAEKKFKQLASDEKG
ncbi:hypothetical protein Tco_0216130 [Tanacetum coccineum]